MSFEENNLRSLYAVGGVGSEGAGVGAKVSI